MAGGPLPNTGAIAGQAGDAVAPITSVLTALPVLGRAFADLGQVLQSLSGQIIPDMAQNIAKLGNSIVGIVGKANPAVAEQFNLALNDTTAVLGQALMPVLKVVTQLMRLFGDALASFSGPLGDVLGEIAEALIPVFELLADAFARIGQAVVEVLRFLMPFIKVAIEGVRTIFEWIGKAIRFLLDLIGIDIGESPVKKGASVGAAARQANITSVSDVIAQAQKSAFSLGTASGPNFAAVTAKSTVEIRGVLGEILATLRNPLRVIDVLAEIEKTKADSARLAEEGRTFYDKNLEEARARRLLADLATSMTGFGVLPKARIAPRDGSGTVPAGGP